MANDQRGDPDVQFEFDHDPDAPRRARLAMQPILHDDAGWAGDVTLATSEMVSNVIQHTDDGGALRAWDSDPVTVEVSDRDRTPPWTAEVSDHGGRGIGIIGAIAETWGVEPNEGGKVVWARFRRPPHGAASSSDPDGRQLPAAP